MRFVRPTQTTFFALALVLAMSACGGGAGAADGTAAPRRGSANRITADELSTMAQFDAFTAIGRLRPQWLRSGSRGSMPGVVVNGTAQAGGVETLKNLRASDIRQMEFMDPSDATTRFGSGYLNGAIVVTTGR